MHFEFIGSPNHGTLPHSHACKLHLVNSGILTFSSGLAMVEVVFTELWIFVDLVEIDREFKFGQGLMFDVIGVSGSSSCTFRYSDLGSSISFSWLLGTMSSLKELQIGNLTF